MGDRVYCDLQLLSPTPQSVIDALAECSTECSKEDGWFNFCEVNYGELDNMEDVSVLLTENALSFEWSWGSGYELDRGTQYFRADTEKGYEFQGHEPTFSLKQISENDPEIEEARIWVAWRKDATKNFRIISEEEMSYFKAAQEKFFSDDNVEVDSDARVSIGIDGAFVQAWVWIDASELNP